MYVIKTGCHYILVLVPIICDFSRAMKKFEFSREEPRQESKFSGFNFYKVYKDAEFLRSSDNIETILSRSHELRKTLKTVPPGQTIVVEGMKLERNTPLLVKNTTGPNIAVEEYEFTCNRLTGLAAAYAFENRHRFPLIKSSEAATLGLTWDNNDVEKCRLYLSAVTGTEHFYDQFLFWPLICAIRKFQLKKLTPELVVKTAKIKNNKGERLAKEFKENCDEVARLWKNFPGGRPEEILHVLGNAPYCIKKEFK